MTREGKSSSGKPLPSTTFKSSQLLDSLKQAYRAFTTADFAACRESLDFILKSIPLVVAATRSETNDLKELLDVCREYLTALRIKAKMGETQDTARSLELAAYFTHCNLQPSHLMLALKNAMASAFKAKNFINAASFARRLLELPDVNTERHADTRNKAQKVVQKSEKEGRNEHQIDYDERNPFSLDCKEFKPIYKGSPAIKCPYCGSSYVPATKGEVCSTCTISQIGVETVGLVTQAGASQR
jgi:coatomer protein complex subunit alpha (xenin)